MYARESLSAEKKSQQPVKSAHSNPHKPMFVRRHAQNIHTIIRPKLKVGSANDSYEQEADRVAHQVTSIPATIQKKSSCGCSGGCTKCQAKTSKATLSTAPTPKISAASAVNDSSSKSAPVSVENVLHQPGQSLDKTTRRYFESRIGYDFSNVRIHTNHQAALSAQDIQARAYTAGTNIVFDKGEYNPRSTRGRFLLAHELTHVVQQRNQAINSAQSVRRIASAASVPATGSGGKALLGSASAAGASGSSATGDRSSAEGHGSGGPGGGERPVGTCRVDVRATHISHKWMPFRHLYIVHEDAAGNVTAYRGGPTGGAPAPHGNIGTRHGPYRPGFIDWDPGAPSVRVLSGATACGKNSCFISELSRITARRVPYSPTGPNSNTVVKTLLDKCDVPKRIPVSSLRVPGWGDPVL